MRFRPLPAALVLVVIAGSAAAVSISTERDPHDAAPSHAPATATGKTSPAKKSPAVNNSKITPANASSTSATHSRSKTASKSTTKVPTKSDAHAAPSDEHEDDKPGNDADGHGNAHKPAPSASKTNNAYEETSPDAAEALSLLTEGNARWVNNKPHAPNTDNARREEVASGQRPMVTILTCADSRIPVERVFDRGVGDAFVIRVAGNVAGGSETGTIEYGVEHLKTPLLVVMGHTKCGAVAAAATNAPVHGFVAKLVSNIQPAVERARRANPNADDATLTSFAINENVWQSVFDLYKSSQPVRELAASGKLKVVGAVYDITTGKVEFLGEHPWQNELLASLANKSGAVATNVEAKPAATASASTTHSGHEDHSIDSSGH